MPLHRIVMRWPETLATLLGAGIDLAEEGGLPLGEAVPAADDVAARLVRTTEWRGR